MSIDQIYIPTNESDLGVNMSALPPLLLFLKEDIDNINYKNKTRKKQV